MNKTFFYSHLIEIESLIVELDKLDLSKEQKMHLSALMDSTLHHTILDAIFSELSEDDKMIFLNHLKENNKENIWQFLNGKIDNIEEKIKKAAHDLKTELNKDLQEAKNK